MFTVDKFNHKFKIQKSHFSTDERELYACLNIKTDVSTIFIDPRHVGLNALFKLLRLSYNDVLNNQVALQDIKTEYEYCYNHFLTVCERKLPYFYLFYKHQKDVLFFSSHRKVSQSSMEQGLGKTITAISDSLIHDFKTTVIITTSTSKWNWLSDLCDIGKQESEIHWGFDVKDFTVLDSKKSVHSNTEKYILVNYDMLEKHHQFIVNKKPQHIIIDECHKIKNKDSKRTKRVIDICRKTNAKISLLSGTPSPNKTVDYYTYLNIANHPYGRNYYQFLREFCVTVKTPYGTTIVGAKNTDKLNASIANFMVRKIKARCLDLPEKNYIKTVFELNDYKEEYDKVYKEFIKNQNLKNKNGGEVAIHSLNRIVAQAKLIQTYELIDSMIEDETINIVDGKEVCTPKKIAIYTTYKNCIDALMEKYKGKAVKIDGSVDSKDRMKVVNQFKNDNNVQIFIGQTEAAAEALNLTWCSDLIILNFPFTQNQLDQITDRFHRIGQKNSLNVYMTMCKNTIDEQLYKLMTHKYKDTSHLVDGRPMEIQTSDINISTLLEELLKAA